LNPEAWLEAHPAARGDHPGVEMAQPGAKKAHPGAKKAHPRTFNIETISFLNR